MPQMPNSVPSPIRPPHTSPIPMRRSPYTHMHDMPDQTARFHKTSAYQQPSSPVIRAPPPGFNPGQMGAREHEPTSLLSADAPVFTPNTFSSPHVPPRRQSPDHGVDHVQSHPKFTPHREQNDRWDQPRYFDDAHIDPSLHRPSPGPSNGRRISPNVQAGSREKSADSVTESGSEIVWSNGNSVPNDNIARRTYIPPRIFPNLFPENGKYGDFHESIEDGWDKEMKENDELFSDLYDKDYQGFVDERYAEELQRFEEEIFGSLDFYRNAREHSPPLPFTHKGETKQRDRYFDPEEFYTEKLAPRRERFYKDPFTDNRRDGLYREQNDDHLLQRGSFPGKGVSERNNAARQYQSSNMQANDNISYFQQLAKDRGAKAENELRKMEGFHYTKVSDELLEYAKLYVSDIVDKLCHRELCWETEPYYIWKYICTAVGVEISWSEAEALQTDEIVQKAKKMVTNVKNRIRENVKMEIVNGGIIVNKKYEKQLDEYIMNLEKLMQANQGQDPFKVLETQTPDTRPKIFETKEESGKSDSMEELDFDANADQLENWVVMLPEDDVQFNIYECEYCRKHGFKSEGHWELNCYYYITGCCPLCGSESHISPYCPTPPEEMTFHQSVMYVRQLAFFYGPRVLEYFPSVNETLESAYNNVVIFDPLQKRLVTQPIISKEPIILWKEYDENTGAVKANSKLDLDPLTVNNRSSPAICGRSPQTTPALPPCTPEKTPVKEVEKDEEQLEEIVDLNISNDVGYVDVDPSDLYEETGLIQEYEIENASPLLHPIQQKKTTRESTAPNQAPTAVLPFGSDPSLDPANLNAEAHLKLIKSQQSVIPLTMPSGTLDPIPFPNLPPEQRNELIRRIQQGDITKDNLVYPILPVPSSTVLIMGKLESVQPNSSDMTAKMHMPAGQTFV